MSLLKYTPSTMSPTFQRCPFGFQISAFVFHRSCNSKLVSLKTRRLHSSLLSLNTIVKVSILTSSRRSNSRRKLDHLAYYREGSFSELRLTHFLSPVKNSDAVYSSLVDYYRHGSIVYASPSSSFAIATEYSRDLGGS
ncbi:hypothetical protein ABKN59_007493 [Abortiporus biennis]